MHEVSAPKINKWPFYIADVALLALAIFIFRQAGPLTDWQVAAAVACVVVGAVFSVWPFIIDYRATAKLAETDALTSVVTQIKNIEDVAKRISDATAQWQTVNDFAEKTTVAARDIAGRIAAEAKGFTDFMAKANSTEKSQLKIEVEKLRRSEGEWLQVNVKMFDQMFALHAGVMRIGAPKIAEQISQFVNGSRESARRIGLVPFLAAPGEKFDPQRHKTADGKVPSADAIVSDTLGVGYTFQGQMLRPAVVQIQETTLPQPAQPELPAEREEPAEETNELPLNEF